MSDYCSQGKMIMQDKLEKERNDAKNAVEEYVWLGGETEFTGHNFLKSELL